MGVDFEAVKDSGLTFRLNWAGISKTLDVLRPLGVLDEESDHDPFLPNLSESEHDAIAEKPSPVPGTVAAYKFATNDGWLVNPDECRLLAGAVAKIPDPPEYVARLGAFCLNASASGGFKVH